MKQQLADLNQMMEEIVRVRKAVMDKKLIEFETSAEENPGVFSQIKKELLNLRNAGIEMSSITLLRDNMKKFKDFMDKVDSMNFGTSVDEGFQFNPETTGIEEIKNINKLKDLMSRLGLTL